MSTNLDVLRRARGLYSGIAVALPDRQRRVLAVAGLNVLAVGLAFGALHVGGVIVSGNRQGPLIAAVEPRDDLVALPAASAPSPHLAPTAPFVLATSVGADILYAEPLLPAASFGDGSSFPAKGRFVAPPGSVAATEGPPPPSTPPPIAAPPPAVTLADILPPVARIVRLAEFGRATAAAQLRPTTSPLVQIADNSLDVPGSSGGAVGSTNVGARASVSGGGVTVAAAVTAQAITPVTVSVARVAGNVTGLLR
jgi:hypothetical protein